jgi:hypothetical protein
MEEWLIPKIPRPHNQTSDGVIQGCWEENTTKLGDTPGASTYHYNNSR